MKTQESCLKDMTVLYVEDDDVVRQGYEKAFKRVSKALYVAKDGEEALTLYKRYKPDIIVSDIKMPKKNGIELAKDIKKINPHQIIVFATAYSDSKYTLEALELQVDGYITKPVDKKRLMSKLNIFAKNIINERENIKKTKILQNILDNQIESIVVTDFENIDFVSTSFLNMLNLSNRDSFLKKYKKFTDIFLEKEGYIFAKDKREFMDIYNHTAKEKKMVLVETKEGIKSFYINIQPIGIDQDTLYLISLIDITYLQEEKLKARYEATHDELTGCYNRAKFNEIFDVEYHRADRYQRPLSIAIIDIDHFKNINDIYGHTAGDEVLKTLVDICKKYTRKTDFFARWGGEEFVLLMSETSLNEAKEVCEHLRKKIEKTKFNNSIYLTVSIGLSQMKYQESKEELFQRTDELLYNAKRNGRNKTQTEITI